MAKPQRNLLLLFVPLALLGAWFAFGDDLISQKSQSEQLNAGKDQGSNHLQQAAASIVAAAKERIATAKTNDEALQRAHLSDEALRLVGKLGEFDTAPQSDALLDTFRTSSYPAIVDMAIQLRLASVMRDWEQLSDAEHAAAIDRFVADIKKTGLTRGQAGMSYRVANMLGDGPDRKLVSNALQELLPISRSSNDKPINEMAVLYEGALRRLDLPGKPLELEGTLLDGRKLDWSAYRGKVVLVDFFVNACIKCREEVPNVVENYRAYHDKGFEVIGVNLDKNRQLAQQYLDQTGFQFPTLFSDDPQTGGWDSPVARRYSITQTPRAILVDQEGKVVSTSAVGEQLVDHLQQLLGPSDRPATRTTGRNEDPSVKPAGELPLDSGGIVPASAQEEAPQLAPEAPEAAPEPPK